MRILGITASASILTGSFESIATATGTGSSATITFSSIPSTYQHLQIRYIGKTTNTGGTTHTQFGMQFNGGTNAYAYHSLYGDGTSAIATGNNNQGSIKQGIGVIPSSGASLTNTMGCGIIDIHDYTSTSKNKTTRSFIGSGTNLTAGSGIGRVVLSSGLWFTTPAAISSISLILDVDNWTTTSSFALYGIKGA